MDNLYIEENGVPVACPDLYKWCEYQQNADRTVARSELQQGYVSSVFLGMNHNYRRDDTPILYETMIFGSPVFCDLVSRFRTRQECFAYHQQFAPLAERLTHMYQKGASWRRIRKAAQQLGIEYWLDRNTIVTAGYQGFGL